MFEAVASPMAVQLPGEGPCRVSHSWGCRNGGSAGADDEIVKSIPGSSGSGEVADGIRTGPSWSFRRHRSGCTAPAMRTSAAG
jgi:hypothetical protein